MTPRTTRFSVSATGAAGIAPGDSAQCGQQRRYRTLRYHGPGGVVNQHDVGLMRDQSLQAGADAVLAGGAPLDDRQASGDIRQGGLDRSGVADRLQQGHVRSQGLRRVTDHWLPGDHQELLRHLGTETGA